MVWRLDRLGRSLGQLMALMQTLQSREVGFHSLVEAIDTVTVTGQFFFQSREPLPNSNGTSFGNARGQDSRVPASGDGVAAGRSD